MYRDLSATLSGNQAGAYSLKSAARLGDRLTPRQHQILTAIVEQYVETGEPVASHNIARLSGLSPATVRNTMAELYELHLLEQPHTSAGRIPTAEAFRIHVDALQGTDRIGPARLPENSRLQIEATLQGIPSTARFLERTPQILATLSSGVGVAMANVRYGDLLEHVHFQRLSPRRILAVVISHAGEVRDRILTIEEDLQADDLAMAARYLNENFRGWSMDSICGEIARRAASERDICRKLQVDAQELWSAALHADEESVYVEGIRNLVDESADHQRLREMLAALEAKERVMALLEAYLGSTIFSEQPRPPEAATPADQSHPTDDHPHSDVRVVFNPERCVPEMQGLVLVAAPVVLQGTKLGVIGVIGAQRMDYENTINTVHYVMQLFEESVRV